MLLPFYLSLSNEVRNDQIIKECMETYQSFPAYKNNRIHLHKTILDILEGKDLAKHNYEAPDQ